MKDVTARRPAEAIDQRRAEALRKREAVMAALADFVSEKRPVSVSALARAAGCSRQFVYANLADQVASAQEIQRQQGISPGASPTHPAAISGIHADLLIAREEITRLRQENATLKTQLRHDLGARLEMSAQRAEDHVAAKQQEIERLLSEREQDRGDLAELRRRVRRLTDELTAERAGHAQTAARLADDDTQKVVPLR